MRISAPVRSSCAASSVEAAWSGRRPNLDARRTIHGDVVCARHLSEPPLVSPSEREIEEKPTGRKLFFVFFQPRFRRGQRAPSKRSLAARQNRRAHCQRRSSRVPRQSTEHFHPIWAFAGSSLDEEHVQLSPTGVRVALGAAARTVRTAWRRVVRVVASTARGGRSRGRRRLPIAHATSDGTRGCAHSWRTQTRVFGGRPHERSPDVGSRRRILPARRNLSSQTVVSRGCDGGVCDRAKRNSTPVSFRTRFATRVSPF